MTVLLWEGLISPAYAQIVLSDLRGTGTAQLGNWRRNRGWDREGCVRRHSARRRGRRPLIDETSTAEHFVDTLGLDHPTPLGVELIKQTYRKLMVGNLPAQERRGQTPVSSLYFDSKVQKSLWIDSLLSSSRQAGKQASSHLSGARESQIVTVSALAGLTPEIRGTAFE
jgi:hypothetical protein